MRVSAGRVNTLCSGWWWMAAAAVMLIYPDVATASKAKRPSLCTAACMTAFQAVSFSDEARGTGPLGRYCQSGLLLESLYLCMKGHCDQDSKDNQVERDLRWLDLGEICGREMPRYEDVVGRWTDEKVEGVMRFNKTVPGKGRVLNEVALPEEGFYTLWWKTLDATEYNGWHHYYYGWSMGLFWGVVVAIGMIHKVIRHMIDIPSSKRLYPSGKQTSSSWVWLKRHIFTPATFGQRCAESFGAWGTIPPRIQSITIGLFVALNVVTSIHGYRLFEGNMYYSSITDQLLRFVSDRTGIISFANFPLIWLFGMRNNIVMWLTGWDFGTYNNFHRWVARVATVQAVVHSVGYTWLVFNEGGWERFWGWWSYWFWWGGELATIFMCALVAFSFYWIRRQQYELFLIVHIVLSILVLITMLVHVSILLGEYDALFWVPVIIWVLDRVIRGLRIVAFNLKFWTTRAEATFDRDTNVVRVEIPCSSSVYEPRPGTYYYLMVVDQMNFWESHPFTLAGVSQGSSSSSLTAGTGGEETPLLSPTGCLEEEEQTELIQEQPSSPGEGGEGEDKETRMVFLIRPYDDFTSRLRDRAAEQWPKAARPRILVDGPYGHTRPLHTFTRVVFVVGGSGIVVPLSYLRSDGGKKKKKKNPDRVVYGDVRVYWSVREAALAREVVSRDMEDLDCCRSFDVSVHLTGSSSSPSALGRGDLPHEDSDTRPTRGERHMMRKRYLDRRLNINDAIAEAAAGLEDGDEDIKHAGSTPSLPSLAIVACGPARMADEARRAAGEMMERMGGRVRVEYFEESFQW